MVRSLAATCHFGDCRWILSPFGGEETVTLNYSSGPILGEVVLFFSPILFIRIGLGSNSYARIWPLEWLNAPLFARFLWDHGDWRVVNPSGLGRLVSPLIS